MAKGSFLDNLLSDVIKSIKE
jgi:pimeloyl-ACP methyl ester carboxylesterase